MIEMITLGAIIILEASYILYRLDHLESEVKDMMQETRNMMRSKRYTSEEIKERLMTEPGIGRLSFEVVVDTLNRMDKENDNNDRIRIDKITSMDDGDMFHFDP